MITSVAVLGAGTMGHGIAHISAQAGFRTALYDSDPAALARGMSGIESNLKKGIARHKITAEAADATLARLHAENKLGAAVAKADLVIEAITEVMSAKRQLFSEVDGAAPPQAILATNTSCLSVTEIAAGTANPSRMIGLHFFNPPHILKLLEIVRAEQTAEDTLAGAQDYAEATGRTPIVVNDSPGFASSRLGVVLGLEAVRMLQESVASAEDIDRAMKLGYGHAMGPLRLTDLVGLDVRLAIADTLHRELGGDRFIVPPLMRRMVRAGKLGKKSGEGFYRW